MPIVVLFADSTRTLKAMPKYGGIVESLVGQKNPQNGPIVSCFLSGCR
jgi:hypothetical protein